MSSKVPFYTQTAILDRYTHSPNPAQDPVAVRVVLDMLRTRPDLRDYFFRSGPSAAWAYILWERGFFAAPPEPQKTEQGVVLPRWDVQDYLVTVASQVPDVVIKHVESVTGPSWYKSQAIRALCYIPAEMAETAVPKITEWLADPVLVTTIAGEASKLLVSLARNHRTDAAFSLFRALTTPFPPRAPKPLSVAIGIPANPGLDQLLEGRGGIPSAIDLLKVLDIQQLVQILEENLRAVLRLEAETAQVLGHENSSWWRSAIEDTDQDRSDSFKDKLLCALRDALETWVQEDAKSAETLVQQYLSEELGILRRLGLYILHSHPAIYPVLVVSELGREANLSDTDIHHELFLLLQHGYRYLMPTRQDTLVQSIVKGPPPGHVNELAIWAQTSLGIDPAEYAQHYSKSWIRDRLWMLRDDLTGHPKALLDSLVAETGVPEHPSFTRWTSSYFVQEVAPLTNQQLSEMPPATLAQFVKEWQTGPERGSGPQRVSYAGLANEVAGIIAANPYKYVDYLVDISSHRPEYADAILSRLADAKQVTSIPWQLLIELCERLLANDVLRLDTNRTYEGSWIAVRLAMVRLLEVGFANPERAILLEYLPQSRDILITLLDDPDPDLASDRPPEGWAGHNDPDTVALNTVRPSALAALIDYAVFSAKLVERDKDDTPKEAGVRRLEQIVSDALTRKLDRQADPSRALHSVYGRNLLRLYWLDKRWTESSIEQIFPEGEDEETVWFFVVAWDNFVTVNSFPVYMIDLLRPKYRRAIYNLKRGYVTRTILGPTQGLASHLVLEYLLSGYDLRSQAGHESLIVDYFRQVPPDARGSAAWACWRACAEHPSRLEAFWPKVRSLWEWRVQEASAANHPTDFDDEMRHFAQLFPVVPKTETITTLWPLMEALLPHIARYQRHDIGWESMEEYLSQEVERDPIRTIQFYSLMYKQTPMPEWFYRNDKARKIIATAAAHVDSRNDALALIDLLARKGDHQYRDIYERYAV